MVDGVVTRIRGFPSPTPHRPRSGVRRILDVDPTGPPVTFPPYGLDLRKGHPLGKRIFHPGPLGEDYTS